MRAFLVLLARNRLALAGGIVMLAVVLLALVTPILPLADPDVTNTSNRFQPIFSEGALLGTDHLGRDLLSRLMWGTRLSLAVGFAAAIVAATLGAAIGIIAGFYGGHARQHHHARCRYVDGVSLYPSGAGDCGGAGSGAVQCAGRGGGGQCSVFRAQYPGITVGIAHKEFVDAAPAGGAVEHTDHPVQILPNVIPVIVIAMSTTIGWMILETAGLSPFWVLAISRRRPILGRCWARARSALITDPHTSVVPGVMILIIVMSINLLGDGVRDALDPRLKSGALSQSGGDDAGGSQRPCACADRQGASGGAGAAETQFHVEDRVYRAVGGVDLHVEKGECLGIIGESGSGKSVTALSLMGLVASPPGVITGGAVHYDGEDLIGAPYRNLRDMRGRNVAYIFQDPLATLHPLYCVGDQLIEAIRAHRPIGKAEGQAKAIELLNAVRIPNAEKRVTSYPHQLSGGQQQRIVIAMALMAKPALLILDEPTTALDVTVEAGIVDLVKDLGKKYGTSMLFISHNFGVVAQLCDRVAVMYAGRIVEEGGTEDILQAPRHPYTARLMACVPELGGGKRRLEAIAGLPPVVDKLPDGCAFADRCLKVQPECRAGEIPLEWQDDRKVRCLYPEDKTREAAE